MDIKDESRPIESGKYYPKNYIDWAGEPIMTGDPYSQVDGGGQRFGFQWLHFRYTA